MIEVEQYEKIIQDFGSVKSTRDYLGHTKYPAHLPTVNKVLGNIEIFLAEPALSAKNPNECIRITSWNIERGMALPSIIKTIQEHLELRKTDVFIFTEVDLGMGRSGNLHVAKEICQKLNMYGAYVPCFLNLDQGNGAEAAFRKGGNTHGLQGHAIISRYPITDPISVRLPNTKDHLKGNERQIGNEYAIIATINHPKKKFDTVAVHLAAHSSRAQRVEQVKEISKALQKRMHPAIVGGDFNTSTYNSNNATRAILSFWRRVLMGNAITHHYPYPENYFEKKLFDTLRKTGFTDEGFNVKGGCTLHYDFNDPFFRLSLEDWLPKWCFHFIDWALKPHDGKCSFKLDWFLGKDLKPIYTSIIDDLPRGKHRYSDHDPIIVDVLPN